MENRIQKLEMDVYAMKTYVFKTESDEIDKILPALLKIQKNIKSLQNNRESKKDGKGFSFKYLDLDGMLSFMRPILEEADLYLHRTICDDATGVYEVVKLFHATSSQWVAGRMKICEDNREMKEKGKDVTYAARYLAKELLGLTVKEDCNDSDEPINNTPKKPSYSNGKRIITDAQHGLLKVKLRNNPIFAEKIIKEIKEEFNIEELSDIPMSSFNGVLEKFNS